MSLSAHLDNKGKDIVIPGKGTTRGLDDTTLTTAAKYSINFSRLQRRFCLSLHYNGSTVSYLLMLQKYISSKQMILKTKIYILYLGNIRKDFTSINMKKQY